MAAQGGYRRPSNPAPVSGPGSMSQRTDGGPAKPMYVNDLPYGEGQAFYDLQTSAPLGAEAAKPRMSGGNPTQGGPSLPTPLFAPTGRPDEPITAGAPVGPGPGPTPQPIQRKKLADTLALLAPFDPSGEVQNLLRMAQQRGW